MKRALQRLQDLLSVSVRRHARTSTIHARGIFMPMINADDGCPIYVEVEGPAGAPVLMLSNSLGTNLHMWDDQIAEWAKHFRVVRYDRRGHGKSGVPQGPY